MDYLDTVANKAQQETIEMLQSRLDGLEVEPDSESEDLVFQGDSADGPAVGYINQEGRVTWVVGG